MTFAPALAFAHASGSTVVKNGVTGTQSLGFGSRGSGLRCTTDAPLVQESVELGDALPRVQQPLEVDEPRGDLDPDRRAGPPSRAGSGRRLGVQDNQLYA